MTKPNKTSSPSPPKHLSKRAAAFWRDLNTRFIFEAHDLQRLQIACEQIDLIDACETSIREHGRFVADRVGGLKAHPAIATARDARQLLLRSLREMAIDIALPDESRVPRQGRRYA
jgi:phage terminase small subunit